MDCPHSGDLMHCGGYVEPQDGAMSLLSFQQEAVTCVHACGVVRKKATLRKIVVC